MATPGETLISRFGALERETSSDPRKQKKATDVASRNPANAIKRSIVLRCEAFILFLTPKVIPMFDHT